MTVSILARNVRLFDAHEQLAKMPKWNEPGFKEAAAQICDFMKGAPAPAPICQETELIPSNSTIEVTTFLDFPCDAVTVLWSDENERFAGKTFPVTWPQDDAQKADAQLE